MPASSNATRAPSMQGSANHVLLHVWETRKHRHHALVKNTFHSIRPEKGQHDCCPCGWICARYDTYIHINMVGVARNVMIMASMPMQGLMDDSLRAVLPGLPVPTDGL